MKPWILAAGVADPQNVQALLAQPAFRKATRNMALAYAAVTDLLKHLPAEWTKEHAASLSTVLGTSDGELDVTVQFLKIYGASGMARPFLFQSSLHNATLGFLSERFGWRGPGATLSGYDTSAEEALETAADWTGCMPSPFAIAIGVDGVVEGAAQTTTREGAAALLLARPGTPGCRPLATFDGWTNLTDAARAPEEPYYHSNAIERVATALRTAPVPGEIRRWRPDGSSSALRLGSV